MNFYFQQNNTNIVFKPSNTLRLHRESVPCLPRCIAERQLAAFLQSCGDGHLQGAPLTPIYVDSAPGACTTGALTSTYLVFIF